MLGSSKERYPVNSIIRYQCDSGFTQRHLSVVRCMADGQWEQPQVECIEGEYITSGKILHWDCIKSQLYHFSLYY